VAGVIRFTKQQVPLMSLPPGLSLEFWLIAARAVFLLFSFCLAAVAFARLRRAVRLQTEAQLASHEVVLRRLADLEARVDANHAQLTQLSERLARPAAQATQAPSPTGAAASQSSQGYQIAIRLAKGGASRDELISGCGLSIQEAELVHRLHGPKRRSTGHAA
jgi:alkylation response protein AidB-like acyl-CoA dehydrogenase